MSGVSAAISAATTTAVTETVSTIVPSSAQDQFDAGWNMAAAKEVQSTPASTVQASTVQGTTPESVQASRQAASVAGTEQGSLTESASASTAQSAVDYEQKWKSLDGIVKKKDTQIAEQSRQISELMSGGRAVASTTASSAAAQPTFDEQIDGLEDKYQDALLEGNKAEAKSIRKQINTLQEQKYRASFSAAAVHVVDAKEEQAAVATTVSSIYRAHPALNNESEAANRGAIRYVRATAQEYMQTEGKSKPEAISLAASEAATLFNLGAPAASTAASVAETQASSVATSHADDAALRAMATVKTKGSPVRVDQKAKGGGSFDDGWAKPITT